MNTLKAYWPTIVALIVATIIILSLTCDRTPPHAVDLSQNKADMAKCEGEVEVLASEVSSINHMISAKKAEVTTIERQIIAVPLPASSVTLKDTTDEEIASRFTRSGL